MPRDLLTGLRRFRTDHYQRNEALYRRLSEGQSPEVLFIGCSDSRVVPDLLTGLGPGELFVVRNVANVVPPFEASGGHAGTSAAIEYAVSVLGVTDVVVCGHSGCGGIGALYEELPPGVPHLAPWLELIRQAQLPADVAKGLSPGERTQRTVQRNVVLSLERLADFPMVAEKLEAGSLTLHGWYFDIGSGSVDVFDAGSGDFRAVEAMAEP